MRQRKIQFDVVVLALVSFAALPAGVCAQKPHPDRPPQQHPAQPHAPKADHPNPNRPPANANRPAPHANQNPQVGPHSNFNHEAHPPNGAGANFNRRQQLGVGSPRPWVDTMRGLTPQQRERVLQSSPKFQNLSPEQQGKIRQQFNQWDRMNPQQKTDLQAKEQAWRNMTPQQRDHIKNDVLPKWRQMPWDRQQAIQQKLGVLQNMPESARNQRLNDPNFTKGMSDDEKSMLRDLSHTHVGGAPEPPTE
jgi:Protein of unknown function (DUF3106)